MLTNFTEPLATTICYTSHHTIRITNSFSFATSCTFPTTPRGMALTKAIIHNSIRHRSHHILLPFPLNNARNLWHHPRHQIPTVSYSSYSRSAFPPPPRPSPPTSLVPQAPMASTKFSPPNYNLYSSPPNEYTIYLSYYTQCTSFRADQSNILVDITAVYWRCNHVT